MRRVSNDIEKFPSGPHHSQNRVCTNWFQRFSIDDGKDVTYASDIEK